MARGRLDSCRSRAEVTGLRPWAALPPAPKRRLVQSGLCSGRVAGEAVGKELGGDS